MNISSIVIRALPKYTEEVVEKLKNCGVCDYHMHDEEGRIIITLEGKNVSEELEKLKVIEAIPHIISADMQMSYSEDELDEHFKTLNKADVVPKILKDNTINLEGIIYNGDLKKKDLTGFAEHFDKIK